MGLIGTAPELGCMKYRMVHGNMCLIQTLIIKLLKATFNNVRMAVTPKKKSSLTYV